MGLGSSLQLPPGKAVFQVCMKQCRLLVVKPRARGHTPRKQSKALSNPPCCLPRHRRKVKIMSWPNWCSVQITQSQSQNRDETISLQGSLTTVYPSEVPTLLSPRALSASLLAGNPNWWWLSHLLFLDSQRITLPVCSFPEGRHLFCLIFVCSTPDTLQGTEQVLRNYWLSEEIMKKGSKDLKLLENTSPCSINQSPCLTRLPRTFLPKYPLIYVSSK